LHEGAQKAMVRVAVLPDWLDRAASEELSYADFLHGLLEEESVARANAATQKRLRQASFPYAATIEQFDFRFRPELKRQVVLRYLDPTFVEQARTLALIGPPGLGRPCWRSASPPNTSSWGPPLASSPLSTWPTSSAAR
jgi:DNA replication protein DnaC